MLSIKMRLALMAMIFLLNRAFTTQAEELTPYDTKQNGIVLKIVDATDVNIKLSIALSFTNPDNKIPRFEGVRIVSDTLPLNGNLTHFGAKNGDGKSSIKLNEQNALFKGKNYAYIVNDIERGENGTFSVTKDKNDIYSLMGAFYAGGRLYMIEETIPVSLERIEYPKN